MSVGSGFQGEMNRQLNSIAGGQICIYSNEEGIKREEYMNAEDLRLLSRKSRELPELHPYFPIQGLPSPQKASLICLSPEEVPHSRKFPNGKC